MSPSSKTCFSIFLISPLYSVTVTSSNSTYEPPLKYKMGVFVPVTVSIISKRCHDVLFVPDHFVTKEALAIIGIDVPSLRAQPAIRYLFPIVVFTAMGEPHPPTPETRKSFRPPCGLVVCLVTVAPPRADHSVVPAVSI